VPLKLVRAGSHAGAEAVYRTVQMSSTHIVQSYDDYLDTLRSTLSRMAGRAEAQLADAVAALVERHGELAADVIESDPLLDKMEIEAERLAVEIIARRSPVADDLRELVAAIKIASALERIGDYAKNIAKRASVLVHDLPMRQIGMLPEMAGDVRRMILAALDAFLERDSARAVDVWYWDERVDRLHESVFRELLTYMMESPRLITPCTHLLFIAKTLERAGDQATAVAELAYYAVEGRPLVPSAHGAEPVSTKTSGGPRFNMEVDRER